MPIRFTPEPRAIFAREWLSWWSFRSITNHIWTGEVVVADSCFSQ